MAVWLRRVVVVVAAVVDVVGGTVVGGTVVGATVVVVAGTEVATPWARLGRIDSPEGASTVATPAATTPSRRRRRRDAPPCRPEVTRTP